MPDPISRRLLSDAGGSASSTFVTDTWLSSIPRVAAIAGPDSSATDRGIPPSVAVASISAAKVGAPVGLTVGSLVGSFVGGGGTQQVVEMSWQRGEHAPIPLSIPLPMPTK